jgi:predicted RNase H-like HicB family nuclease
MKYHFKIHNEDGSYWAECLELPTCVTQAKTKVILEKNMSVALHLFLDEPKDSRLQIPLPQKKIFGKNIVGVPVKSAVAFAFCLRQARLGKKLTQQETAKLLGYKNIYNYQRLESSASANPALTTLEQLKKIFPELALDEILAA